jgi:hypothetical protein
MQHAWGDRNTYRILVGKPDGKRTLRKIRQKDNIRILDRMGWYGLDCHDSGGGLL